MPLSDATNLVVDQTLYWKVVKDVREAWFQVGMLNSAALTEATLPFNPKGDFSESHVHTLPYKLMPPYDPPTTVMTRLPLWQKNSLRWLPNTDIYLNNPNRALAARRRKLHKMLETLLPDLEDRAKRALAVT